MKSTGTIVYGGKELTLTLPDEIPELDKEQRDAARWMEGGWSSLLFSDPGAGKTLTALEAFRLVAMHDGVVPSMVVVCPSIAVRTWAVWYARIMQEQNEDYTVQILQSNKVKVLPKADLVIVTYGTIGRKDSAALRHLKEFKPTILVCDESHNMTSYEGNRTNAVLGEGGLASVAQLRWFLTGTPIPRYADGLFPVLHSCFKWRLKDFGIDNKTKFFDRYVKQKSVKYGKMRFPKRTVCGNKNKDELDRLLYEGPDAIAWRNKLKIPSKPIFHDLTLDLRPSATLLKLQEEVEAERDVVTDAFGNPVQEVSPALTQALHQYGKELAPLVAASVTDLIREGRIEGGVLVLFWHREVGKTLQSALTKGGIRTVRIDGSTTQRTRDKIVDLFNGGEVDVLCGQISSMGVALNLQERCHNVVFAEDTYSNAMNLQAYQRVWRRGQTKDVNIWSAKTLMPLSDIRIKVAERKGSDASEILD